HRTVREEARPPQSRLLAGIPDEQDRALRPRTLRERARDREVGGTPRSIVVRRVEDAVAARRCRHLPHRTVEMRRDGDPLALQRWIRAFDESEDVCWTHRARTAGELHLQASR